MNRPGFFPLAVLRSLLCAAVLLVIFPGARAQMSISGPTCVSAGTQYTYTISGNWTQHTYMNWNGTTGTISGSSSGTPLPQIHVTWSGSGTVRVSTSNPTSSPSLAVTVTSNVAGGTISNPSQTINYNSTPATINCSVATGGGCSPSYSY